MSEFHDDEGLLERMFAPLLKNVPERKLNCREDGHSFNMAINAKLLCSRCGRSEAEVLAQIEAGEYAYDAIKYLDE